MFSDNIFDRFTFKHLRVNVTVAIFRKTLSSFSQIGKINILVLKVQGHGYNCYFKNINFVIKKWCWPGVSVPH